MLERPMLEIDGLIAGYGEGIVFDGLSLTLRAGEALGVMGRNGVGKTTLLKAIMGLVRARAGRILFQSEDIARRQPFEIARRGIGYVPQGREIFADLTVAENLDLANQHRRDLATAFAAFPALEAKREAMGGSLSGGQQQQLAIARVLLAEPSLMLLDEPSDGVQPSVVAEIGERLGAIRKERGMAMILVEQDADLVLSLCDRVIFMEEGRIVAEHKVEALRADPQLIETAMAL
jgi:ABC-type branched-subunit amino acid transport system ATPase component